MARCPYLVIRLGRGWRSNERAWTWVKLVKLIVGLGNPGSKYDGTRHNVGFRVIDELAARWDIDLSREKFHAWFGKGVICSEPAVLLKPTTFMNRSGQAVVAAGRFYRLEFSDLAMISDDLALPPGCLRMAQQMCHAVPASFRIGIGSAIGDAADYVLSRFDEEEEAIIGKVIARSADAVECWITNGAQETMNRYNGVGDA